MNALCRRACFGNKAGRDRSRAIEVDDILEAREHLIESRQVHLDQLADKLQEDRVRRVIEPLLTGAGDNRSSSRDLEYVRDIGLIAREDPPRIANPIYADDANSRIEHDKVLARIVTGMVEDDAELFKQFMDNEGFKRRLTDRCSSCAQAGAAAGTTRSAP